MAGHRPNLTRRRGACEECRQKKVRCNGASPCNHCQRNKSVCEYHTRPLRRSPRDKDVPSPERHAAGIRQIYEGFSNDPTETSYVHSGFITPAASDQTTPLTISFNEGFFSQMVSESFRPYSDVVFSDDNIQGVSQAETIEQFIQENGPHSQILRNMSMSSSSASATEWAREGVDQILYKPGINQLWKQPGDTTNEEGVILTLGSCSRRLVVDKVEAQLLPDRQSFLASALFRKTDHGGRRQQAVSEKVRILLSSRHQVEISGLLRRMNSSKEQQGLDLEGLPTKRLIQRAFKDFTGLSLFIKEQDVMRIQERFFDPENPPIDISDMSMFIVSLAWGALLVPEEIIPAIRLGLLDAVQEASTLLLSQSSSIRQFLSLVAILYLAERTGSSNMHAHILGSISTAASLGLHSGLVLRNSGVSNDQFGQTKRAIQLLYCIDKSYALRWQTFSLVGDDSLISTSMLGANPQDGAVTTLHSEWLWFRIQYSKICSNITQLQLEAEESLSDDHCNNSLALLRALEEWYGSINVSQMLLSLEDQTAASRLKLNISYHYYEARFHLLGISLLRSQSSPLLGSEQYRRQIRQSIREMITRSSTVPFEYLLQDYSHLFINTVALCLLSLDTVLGTDDAVRVEIQTLLSIVAGFFARMSIMFPPGFVFEEESSLINTLTNF